jgi:hypothetical protein
MINKFTVATELFRPFLLVKGLLLKVAPEAGSKHLSLDMSGFVSILWSRQ